MEHAPNNQPEVNTRKSILERVQMESGIPDVKDRMLEIPNTDFQSLFLEIMESKSERLSISDLKSIQERNEYTKDSEVGQLAFIKLDSLAYDLLPKNYKDVELSPLAPFGVNRVLAGISQNRVLSTTRNSEVISDPTTTLALNCSQERSMKLKASNKNHDIVSLATSQRVSRQNQLKKENQTKHFRTFTVMSAGRDAGFEKFEREIFEEQVKFFITLLNRLNEGDYSIQDIVVTVFDANPKQDLLKVLELSVIENLRTLFPEVTFKIDKRSSNYYDSLFYRISAKNKDGREFSLVGGGMTDWSKKLVGSNKERLMFGSLGSEIVCKYFKK